MATFNIIGCCVSRDILGFKSYSRHKTLRFLQFSTPASYLLYSEKPSQILTDEKLSEYLGGGVQFSGFIEKCIINDYNKTFLDYYNEKSDFFIIDFATLVRDGLVRQTMEDGTVHYFTCSSKHMIRNKLGKNVLEALPGKKELLSTKELLQQENISIIMDKFCAWLAEKGYDQRQMILVEVKHAKFYSDESQLVEFGNWEQLAWENNILDEINTIFKKRFPQCYYVPLPEGYYGSTRHKWGTFSLHYCDEVYDYLYDVIDLIADCGGITEEIIYQIRDKYTGRIQKNLQQLNQFKNTIDKLELDYQKERRKSYTYGSLLKQHMLTMMEQIERVTEIHCKPIIYGMVHVSKTGWTAKKWENEVLGEERGGKRIEAVRIGMSGQTVNYAVKVGGNWQKEVSDFEMAGTVGKSMPVTGIRIYTQGPFSIGYQIYDLRKGWKGGKDGEELTVDDNSCITAIRFWVIV